jgi:amidase
VVAEAEETFRALGAHIVTVSVPDVTRAVVDCSPACALEAAVAHRGTYPARESEYGSVLAAVLDAGHAVFRARLSSASVASDGTPRPLRASVSHNRCVARAGTAIRPLTLDAIGKLGGQPELITKLQRYTAPFDLTGHPTVTLPGGFGDDGMPIGFQLAGYGEGRLIQAAAAFERETNWHRHHPALH